MKVSQDEVFSDHLGRCRNTPDPPQHILGDGLELRYWNVWHDSSSHKTTSGSPTVVARTPRSGVRLCCRDIEERCDCIALSYATDNKSTFLRSIKQDAVASEKRTGGRQVEVLKHRTTLEQKLVSSPGFDIGMSQR